MGVEVGRGGDDFSSRVVPWVRGHDHGELGEASFRGEGAAAACITMQAADIPWAAIRWRLERGLMNDKKGPEA